ncbi:MAG TPA: hypothetical protein VMT46_03405 [Anaerolineaceae bacterium]|nr:hypothetical protein [Anaerolineaceae bacterium]
MIQVRTSFVPRRQGFRFVNSFDLLPRRSLPKVFGLDLDRITIIGLCGGMSFAAIDYYLAGESLPAVEEASQIPPGLMSYLRARQGDSTPPGTLLKLFKRVFQSDPEVAQMTALEIPRLRALLDQGQPTVLLLVCTRGVENPTGNHQVVATGYDFDPASQEFVVYLYDPNHPGEEPCLTMNLSDPGQGIHLEQTTGEARRGFLVQEYLARRPIIP